jgi:hypothetical protein
VKTPGIINVDLPVIEFLLTSIVDFHCLLDFSTKYYAISISLFFFILLNIVSLVYQFSMTGSAIGQQYDMESNNFLEVQATAFD